MSRGTYRLRCMYLDVVFPLFCLQKIAYLDSIAWRGNGTDSRLGSGECECWEFEFFICASSQGG
jgi:hypothetical protein